VPSKDPQEHGQTLPFAVSAHWYDALYHWKDYAGETKRISALIRQACPWAKSLLDVACGTGVHAALLAEHFAVEGLDLQPELLRAARERSPHIPFHAGGMRGFHLRDSNGQIRTFDAITCLFSSIGYLETIADIERALETMARHLAPKGILLIEPWLQPEDFKPGQPHMQTADLPELKVCRMSEARIEGDLSVIRFFYQVAEGGRVYRTEEEHRLRLSRPEELLNAFERVGLHAEFREDGLMPKRGLYLARKG
jgi:ubiquinone/menaquinone biosynthesis C-methylase UbiE